MDQDAFACRVGAVLVAILALAPARAWAQQPVKPTPGSTAQIRLPAPASISARQLPDGRIEVLWAAVNGAMRYDLWRSVAAVGQTVVSLPNPADTSYIDSNVQTGSTYYYVVAAVTSGSISGLRRGSVPVTATAPATTSLRSSNPPTGVNDPSTGTGISSGSLARTCVQTGAYSTCVSDVVHYSPVIEPVKNATVTCPQGGLVATGGGFGGYLVNMVVIMSAPVLPTPKTNAGWTVTVTPIRLPTMDAGQVLLDALGSVKRDFQVWVVCGPAGP